MPADDGPRVRLATPQDVPAILDLIRQLAAYEREPDAVVATQADLSEALFAPSPAAFCHVAVALGQDGNPLVVGMALWFVTFSTWRGRHGIWLEDLFVLPQYRSSGLGRQLLAALADTCVERGYPRLEWNVLDWNTPALDFYATLGAEPLSQWTVHRLSGDALRNVARTYEHTPEPADPRQR